MSRISLIICGVMLGLVAAPVWSLDSPTVRGHLQFGSQRYELGHVQLVRHPQDAQRLWILLTTAELSANDAADASRVLALATPGKLRGVRLSIAAVDPPSDVLQGALLLSAEESPSGEIVFAAGAEKYWQRLTVGDKRVVGAVRFAQEASTFSETPAWAFEIEFDAPIFAAH